MDKKAKTIIELSIFIFLIVFIFTVFVWAQNSSQLIGKPSFVNLISNDDLAPIVNFLELNLVNRSQNSNSYFDESTKKYLSEIYSKPINLKNLSGDYEPYGKITDLTFIMREDILQRRFPARFIDLNICLHKLLM